MTMRFPFPAWRFGSIIALLAMLAGGGAKAQMLAANPIVLLAADQQPSEKIPTAPDQPVNREPLGKALSKSSGTITPPQQIDPGIVVSPPPQNPTETPVIKPPGTAGSDIAIQPK